MFDVEQSGFEALSAVLDELVDVDPLGLPDVQVHRTLLETLRQQSRLAAVTAKLLSPWNTRRTWADNGSKSAAARLARDARMRQATATRMLKRADALASMPHTARALADGSITTDHVDLLMHANAGSRARCVRFAIDEASLVSQCQRLSFFDAERVIRYWINRADAEADDDGPEPTYRDRELSVGRGIGNEVHVHAILDPVGGGELIESLERIEHELYLDDHHNGRQRTVTQRRADALVEMARRAAATPIGARAPRPLVSVVLGATSLSELCELSDGTVVSPRTLVPYLTDADIECALFDGPTRVIGLSRRRTFTGALRRIIEVRDRHCQHPSGCDEPMSRCDVDHIVGYAQGGPTSQDNGRLQCPTHNRDRILHHRGPHRHDRLTVIITRTGRRTPAPRRFRRARRGARRAGAGPPDTTPTGRAFRE